MSNLKFNLPFTSVEDVRKASGALILEQLDADLAKTVADPEEKITAVFPTFTSIGFLHSVFEQKDPNLLVSHHTAGGDVSIPFSLTDSFNPKEVASALYESYTDLRADLRTVIQNTDISTISTVDFNKAVEAGVNIAANAIKKACKLYDTYINDSFESYGIMCRTHMHKGEFRFLGFYTPNPNRPGTLMTIISNDENAGDYISSNEPKIHKSMNAIEDATALVIAHNVDNNISDFMKERIQSMHTAASNLAGGLKSFNTTYKVLGKVNGGHLVQSTQPVTSSIPENNKTEQI